ncbi:MAG: hypothetical protein ACRDOL_28040 [Streptosporangiaceae bacterium]
MLVDVSVARSFAVIGWTRQLVQVADGTVLVADGVHGRHPGDVSELRRIRGALRQQAEQAEFGSGLARRAFAAVRGLDELLALASPELTVLTLNAEELGLAVRLRSLLPEDRSWRRTLGARSRRLGAGEAASVAIAMGRSVTFASDDEDALAVWKGLTGAPGRRTRHLLWQLVADGIVTESDAREAYHLLQADDLHAIGGPPWWHGAAI